MSIKNLRYTDFINKFKKMISKENPDESLIKDFIDSAIDLAECELELNAAKNPSLGSVVTAVKEDDENVVQ